MTGTLIAPVIPPRPGESRNYDCASGFRTAATVRADHGLPMPTRARVRSGTLSQERMAETLAVSPGTVAGWETGRRPLTAIGVGRFAVLHSVLAHLGAAPLTARLMNAAVAADLVLGSRPAGRLAYSWSAAPRSCLSSTAHMGSSFSPAFTRQLPCRLGSAGLPDKPARAR